MISINVSEIQRKATEEKLKPKVLPKITVQQTAIVRTEKSTPKTEVEPVKITPVNIKPDIGKSLWNEFHAVSIEQKKLSTEIAKLVNSNASQERLKQQYESIESYQPKLQAIREKIYYAEKNGNLPITPPEQEKIEDDINALKVKAKSLIEKRSKLKAKLKLKVAKNPERFVLWEQELAAVEIEWQDVDRRINLLQGI